MNFFNNSFSGFSTLLKQRPEKLAMAITSVRKDSFLEFYEFIANFFFASKNRSYFRKYFKECRSRKCPSSRSSFVMFCRNECHASSKSMNKKRHNGQLGISNFYTYAIDIIRSIFWFPFFNSKTTFGINKASKISIVFIFWSNCKFLIFKSFNCFSSYQVHNMFILSNAIYKFFSTINKISANRFKIIARNKIAKLYKHLTLINFFNQVRNNVFSKCRSISSFYRQTISISMPFFKWFSSDTTSKFCLENIKNASFYRDYLYRVFINGDHFRFLYGFTNIQTAISINVTRCVCNDILFVHNYINYRQTESKSRPAETNRQRRRNTYVIVRTTMKIVEMGLTRPSALCKSKVIKVTERRQTEDELVRNMLASTASQINCIGGTNGDSPTNITLPDISRMTALLLNNNGYMFTSSIEGDDKFGTAPVRNAYIALCNTALTNNLNQVTNFIPQSAYPSQQRVLESEWGAVNNVRFLVSSIGSVTPNASAKSANVYNVITCAKEAYACIKQDGASAQFIYRPAYLSGPLAQNVTVGWKMAEVPRILNDAWLGNLRCTIL